MTVQKNRDDLASRQIHLVEEKIVESAFTKVTLIKSFPTEQLKPKRVLFTVYWVSDWLNDF